MSEKHIPEEELDDLFRKAAESYEPVYDPEAWAAMDQKLDGTQGQRTWFRRYYRYLALALALLLIGVTAVLLRTNHQENNNALVKEKLSESIHKETAEGKKLPRFPQKAELQKQSVHNNSLGNTAAAGGALSKTNRQKQVYLRNKSGRKGANSLKTKTTARPPEAEILPHRNSSVAKLAPSGNKPAGKSITLAPEKVQADSAFRIVTVDSTALTSADSSLKHSGRKEKFFLRSIQLSLVTAPDLTTVKFKNPESISTNAGLLLGIPVSKRISIVTGAVWANKLYQANPDDYAPTPDYWYGRHKPSTIKAKCNVLDIPLNVRYQVLEWGKNELSVQAGISSYLMLDEKYTYTYRSGGQDTYSTTWHVTNQNRHWLGVQNFSVGYTRKLSPAFAVGAEPFVKLPYKSIGAGKVNLTSAGVFFTAGYTLGFRK
jgi:hypothetical protein